MVQGILANIGALINDTVGVLAAVRYIDGTDTIASVIMGTGKHLIMHAQPWPNGL